jgi:hypothetical protein
MHKIMQLLQSDHEIVIYFSNELTALWFIAFIASLERIGQLLIFSKALLFFFV